MVCRGFSEHCTYSVWYYNGGYTFTFSHSQNEQRQEEPSCRPWALGNDGIHVGSSGATNAHLVGVLVMSEAVQGG